MKSNLILFVAVGFVMVSCGQREKHSDSNLEIAGVYAKEYSFKVTNTNSGDEIGFSTIRDTIFIKPKQIGYEISNNKWRLNDYDKEGWQNMEHSEDHPLRTYQATFDQTGNSLNAQFLAPLYLNLKEGKLRKGKKGNADYNKVLSLKF